MQCMQHRTAPTPAAKTGSKASDAPPAAAKTASKASDSTPAAAGKTGSKVSGHGQGLEGAYTTGTGRPEFATGPALYLN